MYFHIDPKKNVPLYEQIIQQVKEMCATGILKPNEKLPSVRELASQMIINPNTVSKAYQELERLGLIVTIRGKGTFVSSEIEQQQDPVTVQQLKEAFKQLMFDCYYAGLTKEDVINWLEEIYEEIGGKNDAREKRIEKD